MGDSSIIGYREAMELTGLSRGSLYQLVADGVLPHYRLTERRVRFDRAELLEWLRSRRVSADR
jgi:excisionase family DNA binding protein